MMTTTSTAWVLTLTVSLSLTALPVAAQTVSIVPSPQSAKMTHTAKGTFEVALKPLTTAEAKLGRMSIDKQISGDLIATTQGEMLSAMGEVKGSAGYVALERVVGTLDGRKGSFVLQHTGTMNRGVPSLSVTVVPDSGTDELAGLTGTFKIDITGGKHLYEFAYSLPQ